MEANIGIDYLGIGLRWLHIMAAITLFGGLIFRAVALIPASLELSEADRETLNEAIRKRWAKIVGLASLVLIVSGAWNLVRFIQEYGPVRGAAQLGEAQKALLKVPSWYEPMVGAKVALALVILFLASLLTGRGRLAQKLRPKIGCWVCLTIVLASILVGISSTLRSTHAGPNVANVLEILIDKNPPPKFDPGKKQEADTSTKPPQDAPDEMQIDLPDFAIPE